MKKQLWAFVIVVALSMFSSGAWAGEPADSPQEVCPVLVGTPLPEVTLKEMDGRAIFSTDVLAGQPTVMLIYRGGWCPYCTKHLSDIATIEFDLHNLGYQILAISPDAPPQLVTSDKMSKQGYALLSDSDMLLAQALGLAFRVDEETLEKYQEYGIDLEQASGRDHHLLPVPAALVIDREGVIRFVYANPDHEQRIDAKLLLAAAKTFKG